MKIWSKLDFFGLFFTVFGIISLIFSSSTLLSAILFLFSSLILLHCVYNSRFDLVRYKNVLCHYQGVLTSSQDGWVAWNMDDEYIGSSKRLRNFFGIKHASPIFISDIVAVLDENSASELSFHFNQLRKNGMAFKMTVVTAASHNRIEIIGSRMIVNKLETILLWCSDITRSSSTMASLEKKLENEEVKASAMDELLDALPIPVWRRDNSLNIIYCNKTYADFLDSTVESIIRDNAPLIPGNLFGQGHSLAENAKKCNREQVIAQSAIFKGARKKLSVHEVPTHEGNFLGFALDITEQETLASNLDNVITANCEVLENLSTAIAIFGANMKLNFFNSAYQKLTKTESTWLYTKPTYGEVLDECRNNRQLPEHADFQAYKKEQMALFTSVTTPVQELMHLPNGKTLRQLIAPYPLGGLLFMYEDVSDSLALQRKNNTLQAVQKETIDHLYEGVIVYGSDNRLKILNSAARKIWEVDDIDSDDVKNMHLSELIEKIKGLIDYGDDWETFKSYAISNLTDRIPKTGKLYKNDNSVILFSYIPLPDGAHVMSALDITDTCMVEKAITEKNHALKAAQKLRFEFVYGISTEINEPLNVLIGFAELLVHQYYGQLNEKQMEYGKYILGAANQLYQLINNLLDMVSIDIDSSKLNLSQFSIKELVDEVVSNIEKRANEKNITVVKNYKTDEDIIFEGDRLRIKQSIFNLLINAIQFTPIKGRVDVMVVDERTDVKIIVKDEGMGYLKQQKKQFFKKGTASMVDKEGAEGISMPLVRTLVELHGGTFVVNATAGEGTYAIISLPLNRSEKKRVERDGTVPSLERLKKEGPQEGDEAVLEFKKVINS